jgi:hydrogenase/urease accessory protein HupE
MAKYWFARRFPVGHPRNAMAPISREGWLVVVAFVASLAIGALGFLGLALSGSLLLGVAIFVVLAASGLGLFVSLASRKGDAQHTAEDYRAGRVSNEGRPR